MARALDGVDDLLTVGSLASTATDNFTMAVWANYTNFTTDNDLLFFNGDPGANGWGIYWQQSLDDMRGFYGGVALLGGATFTTTGWNHWVLRHSGGTGQLYLNGGTHGSSWTTDPLAPSGGGIYIGDSIARDGENLPKSVAEAAIWTVALDTSEIAALAKGFSPAFFRRGLAFYAPLLGNASPEVELKSRLELTVTGATKSAHPRIIYPRGPRLGIPFTPPIGGFHHYHWLHGAGMSGASA